MTYYIDSSGVLYVGDMRQGDHEATEAEVAAWALSRAPTPLEQIRAIEAPNDDDRKKLTRQYLIAALFKEAKAHPAAAGWTDGQVHASLMAQGKGYAKLYAEEQAIIPYRELLP